MPDDKKKKGAAKRPKSDDDDRTDKGHFKKGHSIPGPGRPALPADFDGVGEKALKNIRGVVEGTIVMCDELRLRAWALAAQYVYGKPGKARVMTPLPKTDAERVKLLEDMLFQEAMNGDEQARKQLLAALAPEKYGDAVPEPVDPNMNDVLDVVPHVPATTTSTAAPPESAEGEG